MLVAMFCSTYRHEDFAEQETTDAEYFFAKTNKSKVSVEDLKFHLVVVILVIFLDYI